MNLGRLLDKYVFTRVPKCHLSVVASTSTNSPGEMHPLWLSLQACIKSMSNSKALVTSAPLVTNLSLGFSITSVHGSMNTKSGMVISP